jgi:hypothetical protein
LHHDNAPSLSRLLFHQEIFDQKHDCFPHPPYLPQLAPCDFSVSRHFDIIEVIEAKSQAVLNTLRGRDFQDVFKKITEAL